MPEFQGTYHGFFIFNFVFLFSKWILLLLVRVKHRKTLYRFYYSKIKNRGKTTRIETLKHDRQYNKNNGRIKQLNLNRQWV